MHAYAFNSYEFNLEILDKQYLQPFDLINCPAATSFDLVWANSMGFRSKSQPFDLLNCPAATRIWFCLGSTACILD
jgi:hypothetical protein